jgi:hypothetical protein
MERQRYFRRGVWVSCGIVLCIAVYYLVVMAVSYNGRCLGWPGIGGGECSFWDYMSSMVILVFVGMTLGYWPVLLGIMVLPPLIGYLLDRRRSAI